MAKISVSKAKTYGQCKLQFKYTYVPGYKFKPITPKPATDIVKGLVLHQTFESLLKYENYQNGVAGKCYRKADEATVLNFLKEAMEDPKNKLSIEDAVNYRIKLGVKRWLSFKKDYLDPRGNILNAEKEYNKDLFIDMATTGILDLIEDEGNGHFVIYDYKTAQKTGVSFYEKQLAIYAYMVALDKGYIEVGSTDWQTVADHFSCYIFFPLAEGDREDYKDSLKPIKFTAEKVEKAVTWLRDCYDGSNSFNWDVGAASLFPSKLSRLCEWCAYYGAQPQPEIGFEGCPLSCFRGAVASTKYYKVN